MNFKIVLTLIVVSFVVFCGFLIAESGSFETGCGREQPCVLLQSTIADQSAAVEAVSEEPPQLKDDQTIVYGVNHGPAKKVVLGAAEPQNEDPETGFKFQLELSTKGAAIAKATFSNGDGKGFDDRDHENPQPLVILRPIQYAGGEILSMANTDFIFVEHGAQIPLDKLHWNVIEEDDPHAAMFEAVIKDEATGEAVIKLTKTYRVSPGSYLLDCDVTVENLSYSEQKVRFDLAGPGGMAREGVRADMRKAVAGFRDSKDQITSTRIDIKKFDGNMVFEERPLIINSGTFLWVAATNKYFASILVPMPGEGENRCDWVSGKSGRFINPDGRKNTGDENIGVNLKIDSTALAPAGKADSKRSYKFRLYLGPKDKSLFDKNELYKGLGFFHTIDFLPCFCCPTAIIHPLAFGILATMEWLHDFIPNYGVVIIILVFLIRLVIHPLTKKSQVSMSKMTKLAPKAEEIKKKYANNKAEINKQMMALYKEQGASPVMGFLPMLVQMPIWISLYSAIYASIALRGAAFLPFWITDLSAPDALFRFSAVTLPLFGKLDSFNLLPILMGVAFYLQQKLMPSQAAASANPQVAQQQKMMMFMMPVMFPLLLYKAPSGLNLYIMASTFAGVIEQHFIKKHIREKEQAESQGLIEATSKTGGKVKKKKPKPFYKF